jgi:hypothetical protein
VESEIAVRRVHLNTGCSQGRIKGRAIRAAVRGATYKGAVRGHWTNRNCGTIDLRFAMHDRISPKIFRSWGTRPQNCSPARPQVENVQRISVSKGRQIISVIRGAHMFRSGTGCDENEFEEKVLGHVNTNSIPTNRQDVSWSFRATAYI